MTPAEIRAAAQARLDARKAPSPTLTPEQVDILRKYLQATRSRNLIMLPANQRQAFLTAFRDYADV